MNKKLLIERELLERVAKPVLFRSNEDAHADACAELRAILAAPRQPEGDAISRERVQAEADALEAKAAPVGELRQEFEKKYPAAKTLVFCAGRYDAKTDSSQWKHAVCAAINQSWSDYQAGAAYQRAQQPQSAEPVEWRCRVAGSDHYAHFPTKRCRFCEPLYTTPQPSAGVVMPEPDEIHQMAFEEGSPDEEGGGYHFDADEFDLFIQRLIDAIARLNGKEVGRG